MLTDALSIYGSVAGTVSIGWNVHTYRQTHRTKVLVEADYNTYQLEPPHGQQWAVRLKLTNVSGFPVAVKSVGHELVDPPAHVPDVVTPMTPHGPLPTLSPKHPAYVLFAAPDPSALLSDLVTAHRRFVVTLDNGHQFRSQAFEIDTMPKMRAV